MDPASAAMGLSTLLGAVGSYMGQKAEQHQREVAAQAGRIQADQVDAAYRDELGSTLNNIRAIRATTGVGADSPTTIAIQDKQTQVSDRNRTRDVANRKIQATEDENSARILGASANMSLLGGTVKSLPKFFGA